MVFWFDITLYSIWQVEKEVVDEAQSMCANITVAGSRHG